ncbi:crotonyl-CoA carboxylase/reductase, partial [Saccharothrix sp. MB29]|nr:crotonyl-CoA carboxylase/reductase [Saccharothrix sp. MB29]
MSKSLYEIGEIPPLGEVPRQMYASLIRQERYGRPEDAFKVEAIDVPEVGRGQVLVMVMAAGINYNNVWAARGTPVDVIGMRQKTGRPEDFHIGGSEGAGVVWAV